MSIQPQYHWVFTEPTQLSDGTASVPNIAHGGPTQPAIVSRALIDDRLRGRIGPAVRMADPNASIRLGQVAGQFGQKDFTVAFGARITPMRQRVGLIGNRTSQSHGNFFCMRVTSEGEVTAEVDEDANGKGYINVKSPSGLADQTWHHFAVVRRGDTLKLYVDGYLVATGTSSGPIANIINSNALMISAAPDPSHGAGTPQADVEDLRIYDRALSDQQILALMPPLKVGEVALRANNGITRIWNQDADNLTQTFEKLHLGSNTGVTLYKDSNFSGTFQEVPSALPNLLQTRLEASPKSLRIWSIQGKPFTGKWAIQAPNGQYLSLLYPPLTTSPCVTVYEQFDFRYNMERQGLQLIPGNTFAQAQNGFGIATNAGFTHSLFCVEEDEGFRRFALMNEKGDRWLKMVPSLRFFLRAISGKYVNAYDAGGPGAPVAANKGFPQRDELFELVPLSNGNVSIRTARRKLYLTATNDNDRTVIAQATTVGPQETFALQTIDEAKMQYALQVVATQKFLSADQGAGADGKLIARAPVRDLWETFVKYNLATFDWTSDRNERAIFTRTLKIAENESQVGELLPGEVAFYRDSAYKGNALILYGDCDDLGSIEGFKAAVSSIRLGSTTGATLYTHSKYGTEEINQNRETDIMDLVEDLPDLTASQIGNDQLSSAKTWRTITPKQANITLSSSLSQDYKLVGDTFQDVSSYRTILKFMPQVTQVEVWATDLTTIEVDGKTYEISEEQCVKLTPNGMSRVMITSEAEGINTPGLKIRTNTMQNAERVVIFPDREAHRQLAALGDNDLWNAKDAKGQSLVNHGEYTQDQVAAVQSTVTKTMKTLSYVTVDQDEDQLLDREISADAIQRPWKLSFGNSSGSSDRRFTAFRGTLGETTGSSGSSNPTPLTRPAFEEEELDEAVFNTLLRQSNQASGPLAQGLSFKKIGRWIKETVKTAVAVTVGVVNEVAQGIVDTAKQFVAAVKQVVAIVEDTAGRVVRFVIDTAEKAAAFVEGVVDKIKVTAQKLAEYLRSIFDWGDIKETQKSLAASIDNGFTIASEVAASAIQPVNSLVESLRSAVNSGLDESLNKLRKQTEKIDESPKLPEALEWLLARLTSNSSNSTASATIAPTPTSNDPIAQFFATFKTGSKQVVNLLLTGLAGLTETIALLILSPTHPQFALIALVEMIKDVINIAFDFLKTIATGFLNCIASAIGQFKSLITTEINIPFVTAFFKKVLGINKFDILNLTTLLLAIPLTVTYKLFAGREAKLALSRKTSIQGWMVTGFVADTLNGLLTSLLDATWLESLVFEAMSTLLQFFSWMSGFPNAPDFDGGRPYNIAASKYHVTETDHPKEYWERVMWGWRSFILGVDVIALLVAKSRIKRALTKKDQDPAEVEDGIEKTMPVLCMLFAAIDLGITTKYLVVSFNDNAEEVDSRTEKTRKEAIRQSGEYIAIFPNFFAFLNYGKLQSKLALGAIDLVCAGVVAGLKGDEIQGDFESA